MALSTETGWWIACMILSVFFSGTEVAFVASDKLRNALNQKFNVGLSSMFNIIYRHPHRFIAALTAGNLIVLILFVYLSLTIFTPVIQTGLEVNGTLAGLMIILATAIAMYIIGELIPRIIFRRYANSWIKVFMLPAFLFFILLYPLVMFFIYLARQLVKLFGISLSTNEEKLLGRGDLHSYVKWGTDTADAEIPFDPEVKIFKNALEFTDTKIRDCMIPRADIVAVSIDTDFETLKERFIETGLSKILVYTESIDNIAGYIHVWEVLSQPTDWTKRIAPISFVPESMQANNLLSELMQQHRSITVVVDEFGGTSGIVTMEDLVEEIFGEIEDEYDVEARFVKKESDNEYVLSGRVEIDYLNETYGLGLPKSDNYSTIAGLLLQHTQRFPKTYESIEIEQFTFTVQKVTARKIEIVKLVVADHAKS